jgi:predicted DsbA family dithiol-disulfide isomerase
MTRNRALRIAKGLGLNRPKLEKDSEDRSVSRTLAENRRLARRLGIKGVPFYLAGDRVIASDSADLYAALNAGVAEIRKDGCRGPC